MSEISPTEATSWVTRVASGSAIVYAVAKFLHFVGRKMSSTLSADDANAALRNEMGKMLTEAHAIQKETQAELDKKRAEENECRARLALVEASVRVLRDEVARLSALLLHYANPKLESTKDFDARLIVLDADRLRDENKS